MPSGLIPSDIIFPVFMFYFYPPLLGIAAAVTLIIDAVVFIAVLCFFQIRLKNKLGMLLKLWLIGLAADISGSLFLSLAQYIPRLSPNYFTIYSSACAIILIASAIVLAGLINYFLDRLVLKRTLYPSQARQIALIFAIFTAPYAYLIPANWLLSL